MIFYTEYDALEAYFVEGDKVVFTGGDNLGQVLCGWAWDQGTKWAEEDDAYPRYWARKFP